MDCGQVREWSGAALLGEESWEPSPGVQEHLEACVSCREEVAAARVAWSGVSELSMPDASSPAVPAAALHELSAGRGRRRAPAGAVAGLARAAAIVLALGAGGLAGWAAGRSGALPAVPPETSSPPAAGPAGEQYLLLIRETPATLGVESRVGSAALVAEYAAWAMSLAESGRLVAAEKLADAGAAVSAAGSEVVVGTAADAVSGFFLIRAADEAAALGIARESPHVRHGGVVEVRRIEPTRRGT